ncbi:MAG: hypothetical protein WDO13_11160 [Verrucomicrobiota bacterium]
MVIASRRRFRPRPEDKVISQVQFLVGIGLFTALVWALPVLFGQPLDLVCALFVAFGTGVALLSWLHSVAYRPLPAVAAQRHGESICTFARGFDCRRTDTLVIRAVHEEVLHWLEGICSSFPLRPGDRLERDLGIDAEDIDDMAQVIAHRTGRSLESYEANPYYARIETAADLVHFFAHQPVL